MRALSCGVAGRLKEYEPTGGKNAMGFVRSVVEPRHGQVETSDEREGGDGDVCVAEDARA